MGGLSKDALQKFRGNFVARFNKKYLILIKTDKYKKHSIYADFHDFPINTMFFVWCE